MAQVLVITNSKELKARLSKVQTNKYSWEVVVKDTSIEAISMLQLLSDIEVIICRDLIASDPVAEKICGYLAENAKEIGREIPVIILGEKKVNYAWAKAIPKDTEWDKIAALTESIVAPQKKAREAKVKEVEKAAAAKETNFKFDDMFSFDQPIDVYEAKPKKKSSGQNVDLEDVIFTEEGAAPPDEDDGKPQPKIIMNRNVIKKIDSLVKMLDTDKPLPMIDPANVDKLDSLLKALDTEKTAILASAINQATPGAIAGQILQQPSSTPAPAPTPAPVPVVEKKLPISKPKPAAASAAPVVEGPEYIPIGIRYFLNMSDSPITMDIYTRTKNGDDFTYTKKFSINDKIDRQTVEQYAGSGVKDLYIHRSQHNKTLDSLNHQLITKYRLRNMPDIDKMLLNSDSYHIVLDLFRNQEINNYTAELISESLKTMKNLVRLPDAMSIYFSSLKERKISYSYAHCHLTCLLIHNIVGGFSWSNKDTKDIVVYLSYFHDLALHNDRLVRAHHYYTQEEEKLSEEDKSIIQKHADTAAKISGKILHTAFDLASLVREHHGLKTGVGFTEFLSTNISPLCMVMIVVEEFVTCYLDVTESGVQEIDKGDLGNIFEALEEKYSMSTYLETVKSLKKLFAITQASNATA
jgi:hypothetical protein